MISLLLDAADINMVSVVPDRPNVYLNCHGKATNFQTELESVVQDMQALGRNADKVMIYCRRSTRA